MHSRILNIVNDHVAKEQTRCTREIKMAAQRMQNLHKFQEERAAKDKVEQLEQERQALLKKKSSNNRHGFVQESSVTKSAKTDDQGENDMSIISAEDAMKVILHLQDKLTTQRAFWDMKFVTLQKKFEEEKMFLANKLSSN